MMNTYVAVDLETTGLNPMEDKILEIGAVRVTEGKPQESFAVFVNPGIAVPAFITNLTGITDEMAGGGLSIEKAMAEFVDFCGDCDILGHNVIFDYSFLKKNALDLDMAFEKRGVDTLKIARKYLDGLGSRSLESLCTHYQILQEQKHRACDDAGAASQLYQRMAEEFSGACPRDFDPDPLVCRIKKECPITKSQKVYLIDLVKYHKIDLNVSVDQLTKRQASKMIDRIILQYGRIKR